MERCDDVRELLFLEADGQLADAEVERVRGHVSSCDRCRQIQEELRLLRQDLALIPRAAAPEGFRDRVLGDLGPIRASRGFVWLGGGALAAAAGLLLWLRPWSGPAVHGAPTADVALVESAAEPLTDHDKDAGAGKAGNQGGRTELPVPVAPEARISGNKSAPAAPARGALKESLKKQKAGKGAADDGRRAPGQVDGAGEGAAREGVEDATTQMILEVVESARDRVGGQSAIQEQQEEQEGDFRQTPDVTVLRSPGYLSDAEPSLWIEESRTAEFVRRLEQDREALSEAEDLAALVDEVRARLAGLPEEEAGAGSREQSTRSVRHDAPAQAPVWPVEILVMSESAGADALRELSGESDVAGADARATGAEAGAATEVERDPRLRAKSSAPAEQGTARRARVLVIQVDAAALEGLKSRRDRSRRAAAEPGRAVPTDEVAQKVNARKREVASPPRSQEPATRPVRDRDEAAGQDRVYLILVLEPDRPAAPDAPDR